MAGVFLILPAIARDFSEFYGFGVYMGNFFDTDAVSYGKINVSYDSDEVGEEWTYGKDILFPANFNPGLVTHNINSAWGYKGSLYASRYRYSVIEFQKDDPKYFYNDVIQMDGSGKLINTIDMGYRSKYGYVVKAYLNPEDSMLYCWTTDFANNIYFGKISPDKINDFASEFKEIKSRPYVYDAVPQAFCGKGNMFYYFTNNLQLMSITPDGVESTVGTLDEVDQFTASEWDLGSDFAGMAMIYCEDIDKFIWSGPRGLNSSEYALSARVYAFSLPTDGRRSIINEVVALPMFCGPIPDSYWTAFVDTKEMLDVAISLPTGTVFESEGIYYKVISDEQKTVSVTSVPFDKKKYSGSIIIPEEVKYNWHTYTVTSISEPAFSDCNSLTSVVIPNSVTLVGNDAFHECRSLRRVIVCNPNIKFGSDVFERYDGPEVSVFFCPKELDVSSLNLADAWFEAIHIDTEKIECLADGSIISDDGRTLIHAGTYNEPYTIPDGVVTIASSAFKGVGLITSLTIPPSVEVVEKDAFQGDFYLGYGDPMVEVSPVKHVNFVDWTKWYENVSLGNVYSNPYRKCDAYAGGVKVNAPELKEGMTEIKDFINIGFEYSGDLKIPSTIKRIGEYAFYNNEKLTSIIMPDGLKEIGDRAFKGCANIESVIMPEGLEEIGYSAFRGCANIKSVIIPRSVMSIGSDAFEMCNGLKSLVVYNPDVKIGYDAFSISKGDNSYARFYYPAGMDISSLKLSSFKPISFDPENTTFLPGGTQLDGEGKTLIYAVATDGSFTIPDGVVTIAKDAFIDVSKLESLTIPASVEVVEADAFRYFNSNFWDEHPVFIDRVNFEDWDKWYGNVKLGNLYSNPYHKNGQAYSDGKKITDIEFKEGLIQIGDYVHCGLDVKFKDEIELPSTLKHIGAYAFYNSDELYSVIIPYGVEEIGEYAFAGCELLENVKLPAALRTIGESAFSGCTSMTEVELPEGVTSLGDKAYSGCSSIEKAVLVSGIKTIGDGTFTDCISLNKIFFPLNLKKIGSRAFEHCNALDEVVFPATLESIGDYAFYFGNSHEGNLTKLVIPNSVIYLGVSAFENHKISNLTIGSGLETISEGAFRGNKLKVIDFSEGLKSIGAEAFAGNSVYWDFNNNNSIGSVKLPTSLTDIAKGAFSETNIISLELPDGVAVLHEGSCGTPSILSLGSGIKEIAPKAFSFANLKVMRVKANTPPSLSEAFNITTAQNDNLTLIVNAGRKDKYTTNARWKQINNIIEEGSSEIVIYMTGDYALSEEIRTTTGLMPASVTKMKVVGPLTSQDMRIIRENMVSLQSLDLSEVTNITSIPDNQFNGSLLTEIRLPSNLESIGEYAFADCSLLKVGEIPEGVKEIGDGAFMNCPRVEVSELPQSLVRLGNSAFANCPGIRNIAAGGDLEYLGGGAFSDCKLLETCDLGMTSLSRIEGNTFSGCSSLDEVVLPESVKSIGSDAFSNTALRDIDFVAGVESIGESAFRGCRRLVTANIPENVTSVSGDILSSCNRLIAVSMSSKVTSVESGMFSGDSKLANISCAALEAPEAMSGAFDGIRERYVSLTVPTLSFRSYLNAPQWGRFQSIQNRIPVTIDPGVEVSNVTEEEYQEMLREDALEEAAELAAQESGAEPEQVVARRVARRSGVRRAAAEGRSFARLFDGAQIQTGSEGKGTRVFINPEEGVTVTSVLYNGKEMVQDMEGNSLLLPAGSNGSLVIRTNSVVTAVDGINTGIAEGPVEVYDLQGFKVADSLEGLAKGMYIVRQGGFVKKIAVK